MTILSMYKVCCVLSVVICLRLTCLADNQVQDRSKYKYGYVISHKGGSTQAHLESRDGNLALGRYYVNLHNGTGQKVTYFADDLGFHTGVVYSSQDGKGSSKTQIAMGQKALAAFGDSEQQQNGAVTVKSPTLLFGKKILSAAINAVTPKSEVPKLNYTPVPGGFYLTHESVETSKNTTEHPRYIGGLTSRTYSSQEGKYSDGISQNKANTQTFYTTSDNVKNGINQLHIQPTTPSIKSYSAIPQQSVIFSAPQNGGTQFSQKDQTVKVSTYATNLNDLSYSKEKSIEKNDFADIDAQIISEVQKHAEQIIMKDLQKTQNVNLQNDFAQFSGFYNPSTVTMQPIVVTNDGETGFNQIISTTPIPEVIKLSKNLQPETINSVTITEKNSDQALEDSGYFRVSLSPSLASSINVSQTPHQSINVDQNSVSNNSTLCEFNLCEKDNQIFSIDLNKVKTQNEKEISGSVSSETSDSSGTNKVVHTFYPENKLHDEKHYITTIDVQKAISLDVNQNEAGSIHLAQNFPFNKIKSFDSPPSQYNENPTAQPLISNQISVTPGSLEPQLSPESVTAQPPYILNTVTTAPGLFDVTPNQNLVVLQGLNEVSSSPIQYNPEVQDRIGNNRLGYENQLVVPPAPVVLTNEAAEEYRQKQAEDLNQVEKSIQELRQQILSNIDAQHEEEQRKQNLVDEERKQYFENLKKVEALKEQNSISYNADINSESNVIQATASPVSSVENANNVELVPQTQYVSAPQATYNSAPGADYNSAPQPDYNPTPQPHYEPPSQPQYTPPQPHYEPQNQPQYTPPQPHYEPPSQPQYTPAPQPQYEQTVQTQYVPANPAQFDSTAQPQFNPPPQSFQTEIKDFTHEVAVPQPSPQQIQNNNVYQKPTLQYVQTSNEGQQYSIYNTQNLYTVDNNIQQSAPAYTTEKVQLNSYVPQLAFQTRYAVPQVPQQEDKNKKVQLSVLNSQLNTVPVSFTTETIAQSKVPDSKRLLVNRLVPFDYSRFLHVKQPLPLIQPYQIPLSSETKLSEIYPVAQQVALPVQIPQTYKFITYPDIAPVSNKQYHSALTQKPNKLRVQPLKPSTPSEDSQREAVQNLLSQPQFHHTYYYSGLPFNNRLQLRHIRKNQISNSDQVRSQSVRRGKSLKNLRIEYGFKPPLRPSVEFSEEVKPSIYGPSVQPH